MVVSNRNKRRLLGFVASRGGRVTSGRNESLLRWVFEVSAKQAYAHERIHELEEIFEALEADGDLVLERDEYGKLFAAHLAKSVNFEHADFENDMFESTEDLWKMITVLMSTNAQLRNELSGADVELALDMAATAEARIQELVVQYEAACEVIAAQAADVATPEQLAEAQSELATVRMELATANSRYEALLAVLSEKTESWNREKRDLRNRLSVAGNEAARMRDEVAAARAVAQLGSLDVMLEAESESHRLVASDSSGEA